MKNILLFTSLICLTINGWAQKNIALPSILNDYELDCNDKSNLNNVKGLGQVLWSDDFDDTTSATSTTHTSVPKSGGTTAPQPN